MPTVKELVDEYIQTNESASSIVGFLENNRQDTKTLLKFQVQLAKLGYLAAQINLICFEEPTDENLAEMSRMTSAIRGYEVRV